MPDKDCPECGHKLSKNGQDIPFETFLGFDGDKVPDIDLNFSGEDQPSAHLDVRDIFGSEYAFGLEPLVPFAARRLRICKGYERDYGKFYRTPKFGVWRRGCRSQADDWTTPGGIVVIPNYMIFMTLHRSNIQLTM